MVSLKTRLPELCGYIPAFFALLLIGYTGACTPKPQERWNSYYYGTSMRADYGFQTYTGQDTDDNYQLPRERGYTGEERSFQDERLLHGLRRP